MCERSTDHLPRTCPQLGTWTTTQACALTGHQTSSLVVCRMMPSPLSHTSQGNIHGFSPLPLTSLLFKGQLYFHSITIMPLGKLFLCICLSTQDCSFLSMYYFYTFSTLEREIYMECIQIHVLDFQLLKVRDHALLSLCFQILAYTCLVNIWTETIHYLF